MGLKIRPGLKIALKIQPLLLKITRVFFLKIA
jgi:hypothetical protein